ncbi:uncharacterized protein LOC120424067 [Culex pipiens pallens]|uniref:uncharacterized protein LOC120424067 n=1 Tax=Culex pipiens pallens TaxID=42434 RepID=UPI001954649D|nr:uncharacterized protein LOC120424067 [Culex pipiens pallens]
MSFLAPWCLPIVGNRHFPLLPLGPSPVPPGDVMCFRGSAYTDRQCGWNLPEPLFYFIIIAGAAASCNIDRSSIISSLPNAAAFNGVIVRAAVCSTSHASIAAERCTLSSSLFVPSRETAGLINSTNFDVLLQLGFVLKRRGLSPLLRVLCCFQLCRLCSGGASPSAKPPSWLCQRVGLPQESPRWWNVAEPFRRQPTRSRCVCPEFSSSSVCRAYL